VLTPALEALGRILAAIPHPDQVRDIDLGCEGEAVQFSWRGHRFRVPNSLFVVEVEGGTLPRTDLAILLEALLKGRPEPDPEPYGRTPPRDADPARPEADPACAECGHPDSDHARAPYRSLWPCEHEGCDCADYRPGPDPEPHGRTPDA
jgi:hypothetical protein